MRWWIATEGEMYTPWWGRRIFRWCSLQQHLSRWRENREMPLNTSTCGRHKIKLMCNGSRAFCLTHKWQVSHASFSACISFIPHINTHTATLYHTSPYNLDMIYSPHGYHSQSHVFITTTLYEYKVRWVKVPQYTYEVFMDNSSRPAEILGCDNLSRPAAVLVCDSRRECNHGKFALVYVKSPAMTNQKHFIALSWRVQHDFMENQDQISGLKKTKVVTVPWYRLNSPERIYFVLIKEYFI